MLTWRLLIVLLSRRSVAFQKKFANEMIPKLAQPQAFYIDMQHLSRNKLSMLTWMDLKKVEIYLLASQVEPQVLKRLKPNNTQVF